MDYERAAVLRDKHPRPSSELMERQHAISDASDVEQDVLAVAHGRAGRHGAADSYPRRPHRGRSAHFLMEALRRRRRRREVLEPVPDRSIMTTEHLIPRRRAGADACPSRWTSWSSWLADCAGRGGHTDRAPAGRQARSWCSMARKNARGRAGQAPHKARRSSTCARTVGACRS